MTSQMKSLDGLKIDRTNTPRRPPYLLTFFVFVLAGAGAGAYYFSQDLKLNATPVRTAVVEEKVIGGGTTLLNGSGYVTARREATVSSKVTGRVMEVLVEEGMAVEADQVLSRIDASNVERSLELAEAQLAAAREALDETRVNLELAESEYARYAELAKEDIVTPMDLERSEAAAGALRARLQRQQADVEVADREVELWKQQLDDTIIRAPFAGIVTAKNAQPGEMISLMSAGGGFTRTGICTIVDMSSLEIEVDVSESYINRVESGQPVEATLDSYPNWQIPCKVIAIIPTADRQKATVKVRIAFDELDPRILPDMSVKVAFMSAATEETVERRITVPQTAVQTIDGKDSVWIVRDQKVEARPVSAGDREGSNVTITNGLAAGEVIVIEGPDTLKNGETVVEAERE